MELSDFYEIIEKIKVSFMSANTDYRLLFVNIAVLIILMSMYYDIKVDDILVKAKYLTIFSVSSVIIFLLHLFIGDIIIFIPLFVFFSLQILLKINKFKFLNFLNEEDDEIEENLPSTNSPPLTNNDETLQKIKKLGKDNNFNILDVLYVYDYISDYQRRKIIQSMICRNTDQMAEKLLTTYTISPEELNEAYAILNLIGLEGRIVTKEEAIMCLLKNKKGEGEADD